MRLLLCRKWSLARFGRITSEADTFVGNSGGTLNNSRDASAFTTGGYEVTEIGFLVGGVFANSGALNVVHAHTHLRPLRR